jgi:putative ABC transport system permease protein
MHDLRFAFRQLLKNPGFAAVVLLTLALGIGANTVIFSVVRSVLLRPLPFQEPERLVTIWERNPTRGYDLNNVAPATFADWKAQNQVFESMAACSLDQGLNLTGEGEPERITAVPISANLFQVLGVNPIHGRTFTTEEETPGRDQVVILGHRLWQRRFGADPQIIGRTILLDGTSHTIVGIMPPGFVFPGMTGILYGFFFIKPPEIWIPLAMPAEMLAERSSHPLEVVARLKAGVSHAQAGAEMDTLMQQIEQANPGNMMGTHANVMRLSEQSLRSVRTGLLVLLGAVACVLLIACANVANLFLARSAARQKEFAIRAALGASRLQVIRQLLTESVLLAMLGGALGILFAHWGVDLLLTRVGETVAATTPGWNDIRIDRETFGFAFLISLTTGILFGLVPALQAAKPGFNESLKEGGRGSTEGFRHNRFRSSLVVTQIALALMLLLGAGVMFRSLLRLQRVNAGFNASDVLTMVLSLPESRYTNDIQRAAFYQQLTRRLESLPGVQFAGATSQLPLSGDLGNTKFEIVERPPASPDELHTADFILATPHYLRAMHIPLRTGRFLTDQDTMESPPVCLINQSMANRYFPNEDPMGKKLRVGLRESVTLEIVGVVQNVRQRSLDVESLPPQIQALLSSQIYIPYAQMASYPKMTVAVRASSHVENLAGALRAEVKALDKDLPVSKLRTMEAVRGNSMAQPRFRTVLIGLFGALALILATVGIYGVMAYSVTRRTHEIGVRMALGAQTADVMKLVVRQGMWLTLAGLAIGLAGAFALTRVMAGLLYGVTATDPLTFTAVPALLFAVALFACWLPAHRATKVDPMEALRYE